MTADILATHMVMVLTVFCCCFPASHDWRQKQRELLDVSVCVCVGVVSPHQINLICDSQICCYYCVVLPTARSADCRRTWRLLTIHSLAHTYTIPTHICKLNSQITSTDGRHQDFITTQEQQKANKQTDDDDVVNSAHNRNVTQRKRQAMNPRREVYPSCVSMSR